MKKNFLIFFLLAAMLVSMLAGCGGDEKTDITTAEPGTSAAEETTSPEATTAASLTETEVPVTTEEPAPAVTKRAVIAGGGAGMAIYTEIYNMIGKKNCKAVVLCTAGKDTVENVQDYVSTAQGYFKTKYVTAIKLCTELYDDTYLHDTITGADVILVGGGQSEYMLETWQKFKVDEYLKEAYNKGVLCCGGSAGGMCWTYAGWNDFYGLPESEYKFFYGLDLVNVYYGPHFSNSAKWAEFDSAILNEKNPKYNVGYAMENGAALVFIDGVAVKAVREDTSRHIYEYRYNGTKWTKSEYNY